MNNKEFEEEVKRILCGQSPEKVDKFLSYIDYEGIMQEISKVDYKQHRLTEDHYVKNAAKCLKCRKQINQYHSISVSDEVQGHFNNVIDWLEGVPSRKRYLKLTSKPSALSKSEMLLLWQVRGRFRIIFPKLSSKFTRGNLIYKIGEVLLGRDSLPTRIDREIDKFNPVCNSS